MTANAKCSGSRIVERGNNKISEKQKALTTDAIERSTLELLDSVIIDADFCEIESISSSVHAYARHHDFANCGISKAETIQLERKREKINKFLENNTDDELSYNLEQLHGFASSSNGLIDDINRERIWPILAKNIPIAQRCPTMKYDYMGISIQKTTDDSDSDSDFESAISTISGVKERDTENDSDSDCVYHNLPHLQPQCSNEELRAHKDWNQVELDVNRTLARFPPYINSDERLQLQNELTPLIVKILSDNDAFRYYQGFHDVCLTFLLALGSDKALCALRSVVQRGSFFNYLTNSLEDSVLEELEYLYVLLNLIDEQVEKVLRHADLGKLFALSWPLTWFSHSVQYYSKVVVLFDLFLCSHYLMPIYVAAALVKERREEIFDMDNEMPYLHKLLNQIPENTNFERVLEHSRELFKKFPPKFLEEYRLNYEKICLEERKLNRYQVQQRIEAPLSRYNALLAIAGIGALGVAAVYAMTNRMWTQ